jgi:nitronate monooxygenase
MLTNRRLVELFEIDHPIVLAPMAGLGTVDLAAAVSNAGGFGSIGCAIMAPEFVAKTVAELRRLTTKPINLNFFCHDPARADAAREHAWHEKFGDTACAVVEDVRPEVVSFHFGLPEPRLVDRSRQQAAR